MGADYERVTYRERNENGTLNSVPSIVRHKSGHKKTLGSIMLYLWRFFVQMGGQAHTLTI